MINQTRLNTFLTINLKFESKNWLKIFNFVEEFKNMSNLIEYLSGRQQRKTIFVRLTGSLHVIINVIS